MLHLKKTCDILLLTFFKEIVFCYVLIYMENVILVISEGRSDYMKKTKSYTDLLWNLNDDNLLFNTKIHNKHVSF